MARPRPEPPLHRRIAWFVGLWVAGVVAVAAVAGLIRMWID
ncbi:MAG TPA: DUF2474 family protein [Allosphingosinicella sp.]|nr:DUF2474 family protein [Allosphingosinicella sp.]HYG31190.1 DUF2474 family protein [Allosphingosinicella sp.]